MAVAQTSRLRASIRLTIATVDGLDNKSRVDWPKHFRNFVTCLKATGTRDRRVMAVLLEIVREEMQSRSGVCPKDSTSEAATIEDMLSHFEADVRLHVVEVMTARAARVRRVASFIEQHYAEQLTLVRLAAIVGWHRASLATEFRRETGVTVHDFLTRVRIRRAADLLRHGDKIEPVMMLVGYRGKKNFYRHFKEQVGMTPGEFKEKEYQPSGMST
jgi:AraC-like DNA-binding protein